MTFPSMPRPAAKRTDYLWEQIEPLSDRDKAIDLSDILPLGDSWRGFRQRLSSSNPRVLERFHERLVRSLSIETGILERIYDLDRGTTQALITKGFLEELIQRESTNIEPSALVDILRDQEGAVLLVQDLVVKSRPLTKGTIFELHAILTQHQETVPAVDQFGQKVKIPLRRGAFKTLPNNPLRPNGTKHEYCPPEHVDSEIESMLALFARYETENPFLVSAWLHHRFTQIHPFQDGNGRVARVLTTFVLLRGGYLPLVIDRDRRTDYIEALELADCGSLDKLVQFFSALEKNAILQALSLDVEAEAERERTITSAVIASLEAKFNKRRMAKRQELLRVNDVAVQLRAVAREVIEAQFDELVMRVFRREEHARRFVSEGGPDHNNSHWYKFELTSLNETTDKWINFDQGHYFVKASLRFERVRLVLVVSFHHIGKDLTGVMEVNSFALLETYDEAEADEPDEVVPRESERVGRKIIPTSLEPFALTWTTSPDAVNPSFSRWLDASLAIALQEWGDRL
jgi:Fic family protein